MRSDLHRWLEISANHKQIPTSLLLWIQSFYLKDPEGIDLQMCVSHTHANEQDVEDPNKTFAGMAERQKAHLEDVQHRLDDLRHEIEEVVDHCDDDDSEYSLQPCKHSSPKYAECMLRPKRHWRAEELDGSAKARSKPLVGVRATDTTVPLIRAVVEDGHGPWRLFRSTTYHVAKKG